MEQLHTRLALLLLVCEAAFGFYLPGVAPREYYDGENIPVKVNSIKSVKTAIPFDYYALMVCRVQVENKDGKIKAQAENVGELLWGEDIKPSPYTFPVNKDIGCAKLCNTKPGVGKRDIDKQGESRPLKKLKKRIDDEYRGHFILDNLPVSEVFMWPSGDNGLYYRRGYPLGVPGNKTRPTLVNNHLAFTVKIHKPTDQGAAGIGWRIVGFEVEAYSIESQTLETECNTKNGPFDPSRYRPQTVVATPKAGATKSITWSYSVKWIEDKEVAWSFRWDHYLRSTSASQAKIHWFSIVNSLIIVLCLTTMVAIILLRALHKDFNKYNDPDNENEAQEETGWKMVHADVFREPPYAGLLSVYIGTGCQLLGMAMITLGFALAGFLSPARRGALMTALLIAFTLMGFFGGYVTATMAKMFHQQSWNVVLMTGSFVPGKVFGIFFLLDLMLWAMQASNAVPFIILVTLFALWNLVCLPLTCMGAALAYKQPAIENPKPSSQIPRFIPEQSWTMSGPVMCLMSGLIPFVAAYMELYFILSSLWLNKFYYVFGFFAIVFLILIVTCAEISIVATYFQLCYEDYRWWWRSFFAAGACGLHLFLYGIYYLMTSMNMTHITSLVLYFSYMGIMSYLVSILTGTVGFLSTWVFVRYIYANLKVD